MAGAMLMLSCVAWLCLLVLVAAIVKAKVPAELGMPVIFPSFESDKPGGKGDPTSTSQVNGASGPVALKVAVYGRPANPSGREVVVMAMELSANANEANRGIATSHRETAFMAGHLLHSRSLCRRSGPNR